MTFEETVLNELAEIKELLLDNTAKPEQAIEDLETLPEILKYLSGKKATLIRIIKREKSILYTIFGGTMPEKINIVERRLNPRYTGPDIG